MTQLPIGTDLRNLIVVYGGQWGSEGKGDVCAHIAREYLPIVEKSRESKSTEFAAIRVGGTNAGHTFLDRNGVERVVRTLPVASFILPGCTVVLGAGALIDLSVLAKEIDQLDKMWEPLNIQQRILLDKNATFITEEDKMEEAAMTGRIGSTAKGVGSAQARKIMRTAAPVSHPNMTQAITNLFGNRVEVIDTVEFLNATPKDMDAIHLVEGTQGYLLSNDVGGFYPFCTSRNCGPEAIMSQIGINPRSYHTSNMVGVFRTFPIRVGGNSGHLPGEVTWEEMEEITQGIVKADNPEMTTVTQKPRRIARRDGAMTDKAIRETRPTSVALTFLDYLFPESCRDIYANTDLMNRILIGNIYMEDLPEDIQIAVLDFEEESGCPVGIISIGQHITVSLT